MLTGVVFMAMYMTIVRMVFVVVIVIGVIVRMGVLDSVGVRVHVQMRWIGCDSMLGHGNLDNPSQ